MLADHLLHTWQRANASRDEYIVYHLGERGLYAEFTSVVQGMLYGWENGLQLALDSSGFACRHSRGWEDYFVPFCRTASGDIADRVRFRCREGLHDEARSDAAEVMANAQGLRSFTPGEARFGDLTIHGHREIVKLLGMAIFRLNESTAAAVDDLRNGLDLPANYAAIDVRRGDEDRCYPYETYLEQLGHPGRYSSLFVTSDDGRVAAEVRSQLRRRGAALEVRSLCSDDQGDGVYGETVRLLAEILVAAAADRFVSTGGSDVGAMVQLLHWNPAACRRLHPEQRREPAPRKASSAAVDAVHGKRARLS